MSDTQDSSAFKAEGEVIEQNRSDFISEVIANKEATEEKREMNCDLQSLDGQTYLLGEVPQGRLLDPQAFLPLNSDKLIGSVDVIESILRDVGYMIESQVHRIEKIQKKITFWEDQIERNKAVIQKNISQVKQNDVDVTYDKKNRDYWIGRAEQVEHDYRNAEASNQETNWSWLIKKYGLKNASGMEIDFQSHCVEELCDGEIKNLIGEYKTSGNRYDQDKKNREAENTRLIRENGRMMANNDILRSYIAKSYADEIEPLQDGVLLFKELNMKVKALSKNGKEVTFGELRDWAEPFLNEFIQSNPKVIQESVTDFRKLASIPLPARNC